MSKYAIMRMTKLKSFGNIGGSLQHNFRERETHNADPDRLHKNTHDGGHSSSEVIGKLRQKLPDKYRKDAVLAVEYMMTASPEWFEKASPQDQAKFFARSREWLEEKYGKENVLLTTIHRDETTPHMAAYVVPINDKGRLSAYSFTGKREQLREDQTRFAEKMRDIGLERGIEGSKAKHKSIQQFYKEIEPVKPPEITPEIFEPRVKGKKFGVPVRETKQEARERVQRDLADYYDKAGLKGVQERFKAERIKELTATKEKIMPHYEKYRDILQGFKRLRDQGVKAPDGQDFHKFVYSKIDESKQREEQEREQSRAKSRGRGDGPSGPER